jgi:hypothetical protein
MTVTTEDGGRQNMFAKEPQMYITEEDMKRYEEVTYAERAERINGWVAMLGIIAAFGAYAFTGQIIPGVW